MPDLVTTGLRATPAADGSSAIDAVDVRLVDLRGTDDSVAVAESLLTPAELDRARRGTRAVHRRRVLLRATLRSALAERLGTDPSCVPLDTSGAGRPFVAGIAVDVSCSASDVLGIVAIGDACRLGVDVERIAPWSSAVLEEGWLNHAEQLALLELPPTLRASAATRTWTQKEAVLKAAGTGLRTHPADVVTAVGRASGVVAGWQIHDVPVPEGWVASLAVAREERFSP